MANHYTISEPSSVIALSDHRNVAGESAQRHDTAFIVDDDFCIQECLSSLFRSAHYKVEAFGSARSFLEAKREDASNCLVLDVRLPGMSGLELQTALRSRGDFIPIVFMSGHCDVRMSVQAMKAGAVDFLSKPFREQEMLDAVRRGINIDLSRRKRTALYDQLRKRYEQLTPREREIMRDVTGGQMNKQIASKLNLSEITVKVHRASVMKKMEAHSVAELVRQADAMEVERQNIERRWACD